MTTKASSVTLSWIYAHKDSIWSARIATFASCCALYEMTKRQECERRLVKER